MQSREALSLFDVRLLRQTVHYASKAWLGLAPEKAHTRISQDRAWRTSQQGKEGLLISPSRAMLSLGPENPMGLAQGGDGKTGSF